MGVLLILEDVKQKYKSDCWKDFLKETSLENVYMKQLDKTCVCFNNNTFGIFPAK